MSDVEAPVAPSDEPIRDAQVIEEAVPFPTIAERVGAWWGRTAAGYQDDPWKVLEVCISVLAIVAGTAIVLSVLHPQDLFSNTTPTGGDMGAHVWGPRYLIDHLLPKGRLSGWTPDWYDGFPAYQFYMVVPSLFVVLLHVGLPWYLALPAVALSVLVGLAGWLREGLYRYRWILVALAVFLANLAVPLSYNRSFKLVTALGLLSLPVACWILAKAADLRFPIPPLAAAAGVLFIFNREPAFNNTGNIIGGNFQSTMAGEFAFSISLTFAVLYLAAAVHGLRTGRHRALAAVLFALAGLCHLIPAFFVLGCTVALFLVHPDKARFKWLITMVPVAGLLTAFWVVPFVLRSHYVNDMGWERLPLPTGEHTNLGYYLYPSGIRYLLFAAVVGVAWSLVRRYSVGLVLAFAWLAVDVAFAALPQMRLWNARLLPFMYLSIALLAAIGVGETLRVAGAAASGRVDRPLRLVTVGGSLLVVLGVLIYTVLPLGDVFPKLVHKETYADANGVTRTRSKLLLFSTVDTNPAGGWSGNNYTGLEEKQPSPIGCDAAGSQVACTSGGWPEYRTLVQTMAGIGKDPRYGCGRAMWEYDGDRLGGYGTPMALMMLPYFTSGCIGSQEGLYFESSATVPYHFIMQSELSTKPSQPQRDLPYPGFDIDAGVRHMQLLGVKYYLASTQNAVDQASRHPDLEEIAVSGPWHVYEVADAATVAPLDYQPVVATGIDQSQDGWLPTSAAWFEKAGDLGVPIAATGPAAWKRVPLDPVPTPWRRLVLWARGQLGENGPIDQVPDLPRTKLPKVEVTNIAQDDDGISFDVSKPGVPVLVKTSYFPNWTADGADGPYRVTPNLMVVVPTSTHVSLSYGRTPVDWLGIALTFLGLVGLVLLARRPAIAVPPERPTRLSAWLDRQLTIEPRPAAPPAVVDAALDGAAVDPAPEVQEAADAGADIWAADAGDDIWAPDDDPAAPES